MTFFSRVLNHKFYHSFSIGSRHKVTNFELCFSCLSDRYDKCACMIHKCFLFSSRREINDLLPGDLSGLPLSVKAVSFPGKFCFFPVLSRLREHRDFSPGGHFSRLEKCLFPLPFFPGFSSLFYFRITKNRLCFMGKCDKI